MNPTDQNYLARAAITGIETLWLLSSTFEERCDWLQEEGLLCSEQ